MLHKKDHPYMINPCLLMLVLPLVYVYYTYYSTVCTLTFGDE